MCVYIYIYIYIGHTNGSGRALFPAGAPLIGAANGNQAKGNSRWPFRQKEKSEQKQVLSKITLCPVTLSSPASRRGQDKRCVFIEVPSIPIIMP